MTSMDNLTHILLDQFNDNESDWYSSASSDKGLLDSDDTDTSSSSWSSESSDIPSETEIRPPPCKYPKPPNFVDDVVSTYDDEEFRTNFRMHRIVCDFVIEELKQGNVFPEHTFGRERISPEKGFLMTLWYLGNAATFRQIAERFEVTLSSAHRIISKVVDHLVNVSKKFINFHPPDEKYDIVRGKFRLIEGAVGVIDRCHIGIKRPSKNWDNYCNRKLEHSIILQVICDSNKRLSDVFCGEAGAMHCAAVLKKSPIYDKACEGFFGDTFILGSPAYPCLEWLVTPFKDDESKSSNVKIFNLQHLASRINSDYALSLLKGRFRRLNHFDNDNLMFIVKCVIAAAVLHNICLDFDDEIPHTLLDPDQEDCEYMASIGGPQDTSTRDQVFYKMFPE